MKQEKEPKPKLKRVYVKEVSTNRIVVEFYPTRAGEKQARRYIGLADLEVVKEYY